jgi:hypothetical protein
MSEKINLTGKIADLSKTVNFEDFYNVSIDVHRDRVGLQGKISPETTITAKKLGVMLEYDNEREMLIGESTDGKLRIVLT